MKRSVCNVSPRDDVRSIIHQRVAENRVKIEEMINLQQRMEEALERWESMPNGIPDGDTICHLIESFEDHATE